MNHPVTKAVLKSELKAEIQRFAVEVSKQFARLDARTDRLEDKMDAGFSRLTKMLEESISQVGKLDRRQVITDWRVDELDKRVKTLERRSS